jgi:hypothetical protein
MFFDPLLRMRSLLCVGGCVGTQSSLAPRKCSYRSLVRMKVVDLSCAPVLLDQIPLDGSLCLTSLV